jgi:hypothetical protein
MSAKGPEAEVKTLYFNVGSTPKSRHGLCDVGFVPEADTGRYAADRAKPVRRRHASQYLAARLSVAENGANGEIACSEDSCLQAYFY